MSQSEAFIENRSRGRDDATRDSSGSTHDHHDAPRLEPWLVVALLAIIPMLVAFAIPKSLVVFAAAISGILLLIGLAMLVVQERRR
jgi:uncharacterized membrane protein YadS